MTKNRPTFAVIAGTGVIDHFELGRKVCVETRYGTACAYEAGDGGFYVLPRHGPEHSVPPHMINYRANIAGLAELGVKDIVATSAVGSMTPKFRVGELGLVQQFIDFTKRRESTFFDDTVKHTDMTNPYSEALNGMLERAARRLGIGLRTGLVYACAEGPRFETPAEITMYRDLGGDVVGMTGVPEVVLAVEKEIRYASLVVATNWAAGMQKSVSQEEVVRVMKRSGKKASDLIQATIKADSKGGMP